ncbi:Aldehyde dehydrogenase family 2 member C4 [Bienertia sinuspersici]
MRKTFETIDPRNGEVIAKVAEGNKEDVDLAVKAARKAFDHGPWPRMSGYERGKVMMKFADLIEEHVEELAALDTMDAGKLFGWGKAVDIPEAAHCLRYYAGAADKIHGKTLKMSSAMHGYTLREPIGVVGHIIPWNFPTTMFFMKVAPCLAAGCTMVVKPAEQTPLSALFYAHLSNIGGVPDGVVNIVTGYGQTAGTAIASHMDIDKLHWIYRVGRLVMQAAATSNLKPVTLELGGKSPLIIFDDADGEICVAGSRVLVQEGIYEKVSKKLAEKAKSWVNKKQFERVLSYIKRGKEEGAKLLIGGEQCGDKGYYIAPTIFSNVKDDMQIATDEIFGPVMSLMKFKTIDDAIQRANATKYGLAAGIVTKNIDIANTVSRSIRAGTIWINCYFGFDCDAPIGGYKLSGFGREQGLEGLYIYTQVKTVVTPLHNLLGCNL